MAVQWVPWWEGCSLDLLLVVVPQPGTWIFGQATPAQQLPWAPMGLSPLPPCLTLQPSLWRGCQGTPKQGQETPLLGSRWQLGGPLGAGWELQLGAPPEAGWGQPGGLALQEGPCWPGQWQLRGLAGAELGLELAGPWGESSLLPAVPASWGLTATPCQSLAWPSHLQPLSHWAGQQATGQGRLVAPGS